MGLGQPSIQSGVRLFQQLPPSEMGHSANVQDYASSPETLARGLESTAEGEIAPGHITHTTTVSPDGKLNHHECVSRHNLHSPL